MLSAILLCGQLLALLLLQPPDLLLLEQKKMDLRAGGARQREHESQQHQPLRHSMPRAKLDR